MENVISRYDEGILTKSEAVVSIFDNATEEDLLALSQKWREWLLEYVATFPAIASDEEWRGYQRMTYGIEVEQQAAGEDFREEP